MRVKRTLALFLFTALSLTFACGRLPSPRIASPTPSVLTASSDIPALLESRLLTLDWPALVRLGDMTVIHLTLTMDTNGGIMLADSGGEPLRLPLADTDTVYNIIAEAELDLPGAVIRPPGVVSQPLRAGQCIAFSWSIRPEEIGWYHGTAWFTLRIVPQDLDGLPDAHSSEIPVAALPVDFKVVSLVGVTGGQARTLGTIGIFLGFLLGLPFLVEGFTRRR